MVEGPRTKVGGTWNESERDVEGKRDVEGERNVEGERDGKRDREGGMVRVGGRARTRARGCGLRTGHDATWKKKKIRTPKINRGNVSKATPQSCHFV